MKSGHLLMGAWCLVGTPVLAENLKESLAQIERVVSQLEQSISKATSAGDVRTLIENDSSLSRFDKRLYLTIHDTLMRLCPSLKIDMSLIQKIYSSLNPIIIKGLKQDPDSYLKGTLPPGIMACKIGSEGIPLLEWKKIEKEDEVDVDDEDFAPVVPPTSKPTKVPPPLPPRPHRGPKGSSSQPDYSETLQEAINPQIKRVGEEICGMVLSDDQVKRLRQHLYQFASSSSNNTLLILLPYGIKAEKRSLKILSYGASTLFESDRKKLCEALRMSKMLPRLEWKLE